jgi:hypothetical protein
MCYVPTDELQGLATMNSDASAGFTNNEGSQGINLLPLLVITSRYITMHK